MSGRTLLVVVSDIHAGSTVAVCPPVVPIDDGGEYHASKAQLWLYERWRMFWERVAREREAFGGNLAILINGDLVDGDHHNTPQIVSRNGNAEADVFFALAEDFIRLGPSEVFVVRGTEAHVGKSGAKEESLAKGLAARKVPVVPDEEVGTLSSWHRCIELEGVKIDAAHHGRMGQQPWTKHGIVHRDAAAILFEYANDDQRPPDLAFRSHNHRIADTGYGCRVRLIATPAWQLKTAFVHRIAPNSLADIGGVLAWLEEGERPRVEIVDYRPARPAMWRRAD